MLGDASCPQGRWRRSPGAASSPQRYTVSDLVGAGYEEYARIFHPLISSDHTHRDTWASVARSAGKSFHPTVAWAYIARDLPSTEPAYRLEHATMVMLIRLMESSEPMPEFCCALWDGVLQSTTVPLTDPPQRGWVQDGAIRPRQAPIGTLRTAVRTYLLWRNPLAVLGRFYTAGELLPDLTTGPDLIWPSTATWAIACDVDLDSTYIGGSSKAVARVLARDEWEALAVDPDSSIARDADTINV